MNIYMWFLTLISYTTTPMIHQKKTYRDLESFILLKIYRLSLPVWNLIKLLVSTKKLQNFLYFWCISFISFRANKNFIIQREKQHQNILFTSQERYNNTTSSLAIYMLKTYDILLKKKKRILVFSCNWHRILHDEI
jgi:hypothetical protein